MIAGLEAAPAFAQTNDEIIVTATKRETALQDTPVSLSVTLEQEIERARILDIKDLGSIVPSLRVNQLQTSQNTNFIIRGFGNGANNAGIEPSVGVFIDGVYRSRSAARIGDLPKLSRIEVLRGPQSTLFGKNASAGVISIVTASPSFDNEGYIELGYGNYNNFTGKAYVTGPVSDSFAYSLGGGFNVRDGYVEALPDLEDVNDRNRWNLRGQLLFEPNDTTSARIIADYTKLDENCCAVTNLQNQGAALAVQALGGQLADAENPFAREAFQNMDAMNTLDDYGASLHIDHDFGNMALTSISSYRHNESFFDSDADYGTLDLLNRVIGDHDIDTYTQELRLASTGNNTVDWMIGGYYFREDVIQRGGVNYGSDLRNYLDVLAGGPDTLSLVEAANGLAPGTFFGNGTQTRETFTQDNTAWSLFGTVDFHVNDRLTLTGGLNYTEDKKTVTGSTVNNDVFSDLDLTGQPIFNSLVLGGLLQNFPGVAAGCGLGMLPYTPANIATVSGVASCPLLPGMPPGALALQGLQTQVTTGVGGLDLTDMAQNPFLALAPIQFQPQFLAFPNVVESGKTNDDELTWNLRASYEINDNVTFYGGASTGFKATSWNLSRDSRPFVADYTDNNGQPAAQGVALLPNNYYLPHVQGQPLVAGMNAAFPSGRNFGTRFAGPEKATVYEVGLKARFEGGTINIALFDQTIEGFQSNTFLGTGFSLANAGEQSTQGMEVDATFNPWEPLTLNFSGIFLDPVYDVFVGGPGPGGTVADLSGERPAGIPSTAISTGFVYTDSIGKNATAYLRADYQHESDVQTNEVIAVTIGAEQPRRAINTVNASVGIDFDNGFSVQLWARNLFDDTYITTTFPGVAQEGIINGYLNPPRTYGINLRKSWP